jgi:hypothetical protein
MPFEFDLLNHVSSNIDADGFHEATGDEAGEDQSGALAGQTHYMFGSMGRAPDAILDPSSGQPDPSKSATLLRAYEGGTSHTWQMEHAPTMAILPAIQPGEHLTYSMAGCFSRHYLDGSIAQSTTDGGGVDGRTVATWVRPTYFARMAPWGTEKFDASGYRLSHVGGAVRSVGYFSGGPPPISGGKSYIRDTSDIHDIVAGAITIGPPNVPAGSVVKATELVEGVLQPIAVALRALQVAMATITTTTPGATAAASCEAEIEAAQLAVGTALELIATQSAIG